MDVTPNLAVLCSCFHLSESGPRRHCSESMHKAKRNAMAACRSMYANAPPPAAPDGDAAPPIPNPRVIRRATSEEVARIVITLYLYLPRPIFLLTVITKSYARSSELLYHKHQVSNAVWKWNNRSPAFSIFVTLSFLVCVMRGQFEIINRMWLYKTCTVKKKIVF